MAAVGYLTQCVFLDDQLLWPTFGIYCGIHEKLQRELNTQLHKNDYKHGSLFHYVHKNISKVLSTRKFYSIISSPK